MFFPPRFEQRVTVMPEMAAELKQVHLVPKVGYCVLALVIVIGVVMIFWFPVAALLCGQRFSNAGKAQQGTVPVTVPSAAAGDGVDSDIPLMFKDQKRRDVEMQHPVAKQYNFDKDANERFS